jgi:hypothetical protein
MQSIRIVAIPDCKMVASCVGMFGEPEFDRFEKWFSKLKLPQTEVYPRDYLTGDEKGMRWYYIYQDGMDTEGLEVVDFKGGLYAVATDIDMHTDIDAMSRERAEFLSALGFERDPSRPEMGNIITPPEVSAIIGYNQMDYYFPIRPVSR